MFTLWIFKYNTSAQDQLDKYLNLQSELLMIWNKAKGLEMLS